MDYSQDSKNLMLNDLSPRKNTVKLNFPASFGRRSPLKPTNKSRSNSSSLSSIHGGRVLKELNSLRNQGLLCDVTVVANGTKIEAHRNILAANSKFLRERLLEVATKAKSPVTKPEIVLEGITVSTLKAVTSFMYTSDMGSNVTMEHMADIFKAAEKLQMPELKQYCVEHTQGILNVDTCLGALETAKKIDSQEIKSIIEKYIAENFLLLVNSGSEYLNLTAEDMTTIVQQDEFSTGSALEVLRALLAWVELDGESRTKHADSILSVVRFHDILPSDIHDEIANIEKRLNKSEDASLKQTIFSCIAGRTQDCIRPLHMTQAPGQTTLMLLGGDDAHGMPNDRTYTYSPLTGEWTPGPAMPIRRLDHAVTMLNEVLYVAGGQHSGHCKAADSIGTFHEYDTRTQTWSQLCPMQKRRAVFTLNTLNDRIYAVGGKNAQGSLASVEIYDPITKSWSYASHMYTGLFGHASVVIGEKIYVTGGVVAGRHFTNALQCYHPKSDKWVHMSTMSTKRAFHSMCAIDGKLYVFGGNTRNGSGLRVDCDAVECYDPESDTWESIESMPRPVCFAGAATIGDSVYVVGGYSGKKAKRHADVQCFNVRDRTWSLIGQLPEPIMRLSICSIQSPTALLVH